MANLTFVVGNTSLFSERDATPVGQLRLALLFLSCIFKAWPLLFCLIMALLWWRKDMAMRLFLLPQASNCLFLQNWNPVSVKSKWKLRSNLLLIAIASYPDQCQGYAGTLQGSWPVPGVCGYPAGVLASVRGMGGTLQGSWPMSGVCRYPSGALTGVRGRRVPCRANGQCQGYAGSWCLDRGQACII